MLLPLSSLFPLRSSGPPFKNVTEPPRSLFKLSVFLDYGSLPKMHFMIMLEEKKLCWDVSGIVSPFQHLWGFALASPLEGLTHSIRAIYDLMHQVQFEDAVLKLFFLEH